MIILMKPMQLIIHMIIFIQMLVSGLVAPEVVVQDALFVFKQSSFIQHIVSCLAYMYYLCKVIIRHLNRHGLVVPEVVVKDGGAGAVADHDADALVALVEL